MCNDDTKKEAPSWLYDNIAEASKNARRIYFIYVAFIAYCTLTILSTTDRQIILNAMVNLPVLRMDSSLKGFFIIAPIILILIFLYLQLYIDKKNKLIHELRTEYDPIDESRIYPWILNFADSERGFIGFFQNLIVSIALWYSLPIVLCLFAFYFLKTHDPAYTSIVGTLPIAGTLLVLLFFWSMYKDNYKGHNLKNWLKMLFTTKLFGISIVLLYSLPIVLCLLSFAYLKTLPAPVIDIVVILLLIICTLHVSCFLYFMLKGKFGIIILTVFVIIFEIFLFMTIRSSFEKYYSQNVDLSYQILIEEPEKEYKGTFWGDFKGLHLENAKLINTIFERADLTGAHLKGANLTSADLKKADLKYADLEGANLTSADLKKADLKYADLEGANLTSADLKGADLKGANLTNAHLEGADLEGADLWGAYLKGADLFSADLKGAGLQSADLKDANLWGANLEGANLTSADLERASLPNVNLKGANLTNADLKGADLWNADLKGANLTNADLKGAKLEKADLKKSKLTFTDFTGAYLFSANLTDANLKGANLFDADLEGANLTNAHLAGANLFDADLKGANFFGADLKGAKLYSPPSLMLLFNEAGLKKSVDKAIFEKELDRVTEEVSKVKTLRGAKIDPILKSKLEKEYPELFTKPKPGRLR
jgi:uncharacterized protein YjbI with pentapeptide repeats